MNAYAIPGLIRFGYNINQITDFICRELNTDISVLRQPTRRREIRSLRQCAMYLLDKCGFGPTEIGRYLLKDHSTVIYSVKTVENDMLYDKALRQKIELVDSKLFKD